MLQTLVGLFLDAAQARKVSVELVALGVQGKEIEVLDAYVKTFEQRIDGAGIPVGDAAIYKEGVRRGGALVLAGVESNLADRAGDLMDDHGAADIDDLARGWAVTNAAGEKATPVSEEGPAPSAESPIAAAAASSGTVEEFTAESREQSESAPQAQPEVHVAAALAVDGEVDLPGGLHLRSVVIETPVEKNVPVLSEHVMVERRPADREATEADFQAFEQGVMDLVELAKELVVSKKARVVEEVVITKKVRESTETVRENLKQTRLTTSLSSDRGPSSQ